MKIELLEQKEVWFDKKIELHLIEKELEKCESEKGDELHRKKDSIADQIPLLEENYMKTEREQYEKNVNWFE